VGEPSTSSGKLVFKSTLNFYSETIQMPENISIAGDYYVFEESREGNCQSTGTRIVVETVLNQALIVQDFGQLPEGDVINNTDILPSPPIPLTSQITSDGALISSEEPNDIGDILVPQGHSPNGDGINDVFLIKNLGNVIPSLRVYNRYGHLVYSAQEYKNDWDGRTNTGYAKDAHIGLPDGTYYYVLKLKDGRQNISFLTIAR
jgi:gliding motility-associated-like protein